METLKKMMLTRNKALLIGLCCLWLVALVTIVKGNGYENTPIQYTDILSGVKLKIALE